MNRELRYVRDCDTYWLYEIDWRVRPHTLTCYAELRAGLLIVHWSKL